MVELMDAENDWYKEWREQPKTGPHTFPDRPRIRVNGVELLPEQSKPPAATHNPERTKIGTWVWPGECRPMATTEIVKLCKAQGWTCEVIFN